MASSTLNHDDLLAELLDRLVDESRHGREPDFAKVLSELPAADRFAVEKELRELWATAMVAEDFASVALALDQLQQDANPTPGADQRETQTLSLPRIIGDYELLEVIGRGGMGVVYKARQLSLNRVVALKMVLRGEFATAEDLLRFRTEAEAAARLNHPLIVPVYEVGEFDSPSAQSGTGLGQPFFSMQYIEGTTLSERLSHGPLAPRDAAVLIARVCRAIDAAHQQGVWHRDLKPSNILIDKTGRPYVTDFGLAKQVPASRLGVNAPADAPSAITISGAILGTPGYMAPEQAIGSRGVVGPRTDVYALGAILYAMQTGRPPFQAANPVDTVLLLLEQEPPPVNVLNPQADRDLIMITMKALQKPTDLRYATAGDLADDLDAFLANEPITARSSHFGQVLSRVFRPTHQATVLENWGMLWMWHAMVLFILCVVTEFIQWAGTDSRIPYLLLWTVGLSAWAICFWNIRRAAGPVTFVERQIAHVWAGSMACVMMLFFLEALLGLPVLKLSPVLGVVAGSVFLVKAGMLSGEFYLQAGALYAVSLFMALYPDWGLIAFGIVASLCFFIPGYKFHQQRLAAGR